MNNEVKEGLKKLYEEWSTLTTGHVRPTKRLQIITIELINRIPALIGEIELLEKRDAVEISSRQIGKIRKTIQEFCKSLKINEPTIMVADKYVIMDRQSYSGKVYPQIQIFQHTIEEIRECIRGYQHSFSGHSDCAHHIKTILENHDRQIKEGH
ncbi:MAG: hypothetical protein WBB37_07470 [bacterium]